MHRTGSGIPFFHSTLFLLTAFEIAGWDGSSQWRWTLYAANNKNLADSGESTENSLTLAFLQAACRPMR